MHSQTATASCPVQPANLRRGNPSCAAFQPLATPCGPAAAGHGPTTLLLRTAHGSQACEGGPLAGAHLQGGRPEARKPREPMNRAYCPPNVCSGMSQHGATTSSCGREWQSGAPSVGGLAVGGRATRKGAAGCLARCQRGVASSARPCSSGLRQQAGPSRMSCNMCGRSVAKGGSPACPAHRPDSRLPTKLQLLALHGSARRPLPGPRPPLPLHPP